MVDLDDLIEEVIGLLRHSVDKRIGLLHRRAPAPAVTLGDPAQLQNALLNVAINGRDAMPQGGELEFSVESVQVEDAGRRHVAGTPTVGPYVKVTVRDTGIGMAQEMIASAVEPFFTTKEAGKGTGLGLPAVCGIVDAHGGFMNIESTPGRGTDVMVYLPAEQHVAPDGGGEESAAALPGALRVLVIDDEPAACAVCRIMLSRLGHSVQAFGDSVDALDFYAHQWQSVDVIILDMILPRLSGPEVFGALRQINRDARILLCSGFSMDAAARGLLGQGPVGFIEKPFNQQDLSAALSELASQDI
jgi:CheY-like chemotaxis protein